MAGQLQWSSRSLVAAIGCAAVAVMGVLAGTASASVIYQDGFSGGSANLDGSAPTIDNGPSSVWTAGDANSPGNGAGSGAGWLDNGDVAVNYNAGSAYLLFTPTSGHIYTLAEDVNVTSVSSSFYALQAGFIGTPNTTTNLSSSGYAYASFPVSTDNGLKLFSSPGIQVSGAPSQAGTNTFSIILNTTAASWTYQFMINGTSIAPAASWATNPTIKAVGMGSTGGSVTGTFSNFSLTETSVPEPAALSLLCVAAAGLLLGRRKRTA